MKIVFAIDMFNEGVDIPALDTVMMLRPTESSIIWLQQFGRGLRKMGDKILTVIDYIGNHRSFLLKLRALFNIQQGGDAALRGALKGIADGTLVLPAGCKVTYDLESIDIMEALLRKGSTVENALVLYYRDFREQHGQRPTAAEAHHDGYLPGVAKKLYGSWMDMVKAMGDLSVDELQVLEEHSGFLKGLETTSMSRSYKMVLLRAMLNSDAIPGDGIALDALAESVLHLTSRSKLLAEDFGDANNSLSTLKSSLKKNPISAWMGPKALGGTVVFSFESEVFRYTSAVLESHRSVFQALIREVVEWRLVAYLDKQAQPVDTTDGFVMTVSHASNKPILFLPSREAEVGVPTGWQRVAVGEKYLYLNFMKTAVDVAAEEEGGANVLPAVLREWFGPDAGLPGTNFQARCWQQDGIWKVRPDLREQDLVLTPFKRYSREQIPRFFGEEFNPGKWNSGHIMAPTKNPKHMVLLVTMEKQDMQVDHQYADGFVSDSVFQWQSQNSTTQESKRGQQVSLHKKVGIAVHLFVRNSKKVAGKAAPFVYCGELEFDSWMGEKPITVQWRLMSALPSAVKDLLAGGSV